VFAKRAPIWKHLVFMTQPLSFAILGCGTIAPTHAKALLSLSDRACLSAVCDVIPERAATLAKEYGGRVRSWNEILADPGIQAVSICTPSGLHAAQAAEALLAGKHVVVEKPFDIHAAACEPALKAAKESGKILTVISQHRFDRASLAARRLVEESALGRIFGVNVRIPWFRTQEYYDSGDWRGTWEMDGGGCLMNQGIHTVDLMLWLAGPVKRVWARTLTAAHQRIAVEDHLCATVEFASGAIGNLSASTATYPGFPVWLEIAGTEGTVLIEGDEIHTVAIRGRETVRGTAHEHARQVAAGGTLGATEASTGEALGNQWVWGDAHRAQLDDFITACRDHRPPAVDGLSARAAVAFIGAVYRSARLGMAVEL